jgi:N-acetylneuraminic acid mutarotase
MIIWGGLGTNYYNDGKAYNPANNTWGSLSPSVPLGRYLHSAVWTGTEMIVFGGYGGSGNYLSDGGRYNRGSDSWTPIYGSISIPLRYQHTAVWTGDQMIVFGGYNPIISGNGLNDTWVFTGGKTMVLYQRP